MRNYWLTLLLLLPCLSAGAQENIPLLDKAANHRVVFHYTYLLSQNGAEFRSVTDGQVCVEDNAYTLEGLGLKVISSGETRWSLDESARELVIEKVEKENLFTNPAFFIASYKSYRDKIQVNYAGKDNLDVTLTLDEDTKARFILKDIVYSEPQGKSDFSLDGKSLGPDYVVTDLR